MKKLLTTLLITHLGCITAQDEHAHVQLISKKPTISKKTIGITAGVGIATTLGALIVSDLFLKNVCCIKTEMKHFLPLSFLNVSIKHSAYISCSAGLATALSIAAGGLAAWLTYKHQPEGLYTKALDSINDLLEDQELQRLLGHQENLLDYIQDNFIEHAYPSVIACNKLIQSFNKLRDAQELLARVIEKTDHKELTEQASDLLAITARLVDSIKPLIATIKNQQNWNKLLEGYNAMLARQAQEQAAAATQQVAFNTLFR